ESEDFLDADLVFVEVGHLRLVPKGSDFDLGDRLRMLHFEQRERLRLVQQRQQTCWRDQRRGQGRARGRSFFKVEGEDWRVTLDQLEDVSALVPSDIQVGRRLAGQGAHGEE